MLEQSDLNLVMLSGRVVNLEAKNPTKDGRQWCTLLLRVRKETVDAQNDKLQLLESYIPVVAFGSLAEKMINGLENGYRVLVEGSINCKEWGKDAQDMGETRRSISIVARRVLVVDLGE